MKVNDFLLEMKQMRLKYLLQEFRVSLINLGQPNLFINIKTFFLNFLMLTEFEKRQVLHVNCNPPRENYLCYERVKLFNENCNISFGNGMLSNERSEFCKGTYKLNSEN